MMYRNKSTSHFLLKPKGIILLMLPNEGPCLLNSHWVLNACGGKEFLKNAEVGWNPEWNRIWEWSMTDWLESRIGTLCWGWVCWVCFLLIYMQIQVLELGQEVPGKTTSEKRSRTDRILLSSLTHCI